MPCGLQGETRPTWRTLCMSRRGRIATQRVLRKRSGRSKVQRLRVMRDCLKPTIRVPQAGCGGRNGISIRVKNAPASFGPPSGLGLIPNRSHAPIFALLLGSCHSGSLKMPRYFISGEWMSTAHPTRRCSLSISTVLQPSCLWACCSRFLVAKSRRTRQQTPIRRRAILQKILRAHLVVQALPADPLHERRSPSPSWSQPTQRLPSSWTKRSVLRPPLLARIIPPRWLLLSKWTAE